MGWKCKCGLICAAIAQTCGGINQPRLAGLEHGQIGATQYDSTLYWTRDRRFDELTENEDKFASFFNEESVLVSAMSDADLIDHITELESIAFEAKARLTAAKTQQRDRSGKKRLGGEWTITDNNPVIGDKEVSESINKVALRKARMTKLDKTRERLIAAGLDDKTVDGMINEMLKKARKEPNELKNQNGSTEAQNQSIKVIAPVVEVKDSKPLDISKLKFS